MISKDEQRVSVSFNKRAAQHQVLSTLLTDITFSVGCLSFCITLKKDRCMLLTMQICSNFLDPTGWGQSFHVPEYSIA